MSRALQLSDIADVRAYEREREDYRRRIIELKKRRRVSVGPFVTLVFESRETIRGLKIIHQAPHLRHFTVRFEELG